MLAIVVKQDTTLFVVLSHDGHEIERCVCASPDTAVAAAIRMLCRRGDNLKAVTFCGCCRRAEGYRLDTRQRRAPFRFFRATDPWSREAERNDFSARLFDPAAGIVNVASDGNRHPHGGTRRHRCRNNAIRKSRNWLPRA